MISCLVKKVGLCELLGGAQVEKDNHKTPESEGLRPFPKPITLDLPSQRPKPQRRLHEAEQQIPPAQDDHYDFTPEPEKPKKEKPKPKPKPQKSTGKGYFKSVQKGYNQRRPREPKPPKQKSPPKRREPEGPRLGRGDRLFDPPKPKKPLVSPKIKNIFKFWSIGIVAVTLIVLILMSMFRHNAWAVYLDDRFVGYMPINREVETYTVHNDAVRHLADSHAATVRVNETTQVRTVRAPRTEIISASEMIVTLSQRFTYQIEASAIYLEGERIAVLRNQAEVDHIANELQREFFDPYERNIVATFEEDWVVRTVLANLGDLYDQGQVIQLLSRPSAAVHEHTIRDGDTQGHLAVEFGTTIERISYLNGITQDAILRPGNTLLVETTSSILTVRTVGEITEMEDIPMEIEHVENASMHVHDDPIIITEGRDGRQEVIWQITRINGIPVGEPVEISRRTTDYPITQIEEVGTSTRTINVR